MDVDHLWHIGWFWLWTGVVASILGLVPAVVGRFRLGYAAALSAAGLLLLGIAGLRDLHAFEQVSIGCTFGSATSLETVALHLDSSSGGVAIALADAHLSPANLREPVEPPFIAWSRFGPEGTYPAPRDPLFKKWGFQLTWFGERDRPGTSSLRHLWAFVCPAYFPIPFLLILPALWTRRFVHRRKIRRWVREGRCAHCGFDRRAHQPTDRCPECGTIPKPLKESAVPTKEPIIPPPTIPSGG